MNLQLRVCLAAVLTSLATTVALAAEKTAPAAAPSQWPIDVPGFVPPKGDEHPRLFFRKTDLPALRDRAKTPEGQAILKRLRFLLNAGDGESMPKDIRPLDKPYGDKSTPIDMPVGAYSMSHAAGFGLLYQLTGDRKYADLGRKCFELALQGYRDCDAKARYSFRKPTGALRAGPSLGWYAAGYDLCFDGWDADFRKKVAVELQNYNPGPNMSLAELARGAHMDPTSNHWGPQIGGAALALMAIQGDAGIDDKLIAKLMADNTQAVLTQMKRGWGPSGWFSQGDGAGTISSDNALIPGLQAWRIAGGKDFMTGHSNVEWMTLKWIAHTVKVGGKLAFPARQMYPHNAWARTGLSGSGTFAQGFANVEDKYKPALLWFYNHCVREDDAKAGAPFDTVSVYPHRAVLAFVNWPLGLAEKDPAESLGHVFGVKYAYGFCRNHWKDETDIVVSLKAGLQDQIAVYGQGMRLDFGGLPGATFTYYREARDGSVIVSNPKGRTFVAVDFSGASGADLLLAVAGRGARGGKDAAGVGGATAKFRTLKPGGVSVLLLTVQRGAAPEACVEGDKIVVGDQKLLFDGKKFTLAKMGDGPAEEVNDDGFLYTAEEDAKVHKEPAAAAKAKADADEKRLDDALAKARTLMAAGKLPEAQLVAQELIRTADPESSQAVEAQKLLKEIQKKLLAPGAASPSDL